MPTKKEFTLEYNLDDVKNELLAASRYTPASKDILIVVRDQWYYVNQCLLSIEQNTSWPFQVYIWDNGSQDKTRDLLSQWSALCPGMPISLVREKDNYGFIKPNNRLAEMGKSDYIILLNSDTKVRPNWDKAMIGWFQQNPDVAEVGYLGGWLNENGEGSRFGFGYDVDYITGSALCISRNTYNDLGFLFDEKNLQFAYGEDSDLSFRIRETGKRIYALYSDLVLHYENKTVSELRDKEPGFEEKLKTYFESNHRYIRERWQKYLNT